MRGRALLSVMTAACLVALMPMTYAGIAGSDHDFSASGWSGGQICIVCHTPHFADTSVTGAPLWNHEVSTATYTLYSSPTMDATISQPAGASKLCLSCHDGTVAIDSFGGNTGSTVITGDSLVGTDLADDHPTSFTYDAALATTDGGLFDPATADSGLGGTISEDLLFGGSMECATCHDVHNKAGIDELLRVSNAGSALCLTCHDI